MHQISDIKNQKLKDFLTTYKHFTSLSDEEKQKYLEKIILMGDEEQEKVYSFIYEENEKEKVRMLKALNEKLMELNKVRTKIQIEESEAENKELEEDELSKLEKELAE